MVYFERKLFYMTASPSKLFCFGMAFCWQLQRNYSGNIKVYNVNQFKENINVLLFYLVVFIKKMKLLYRCSAYYNFPENLRASDANVFPVNVQNLSKQLFYRT